MLYLLNWRVWVLAALLIAFPTTYFKGRHDGNKACQTATALATAKANESARETEKLRQRSVDVAVDKAAVREKVLLADAAGARRESASLRDALSAAQQPSGEPASASVERAATYAKLLVASSDALAEMAGHCDGHVSDLQTLIDAWPK